jgi:hypothetical protein
LRKCALDGIINADYHPVDEITGMPLSKISQHLLSLFVVFDLPCQSEQDNL